MEPVLGTAQLNRDYGIQRSEKTNDSQRAHKILDEAHRQNIQYLDTAPLYGESESIIGSFMENFDSNPFKIITKLPSLNAQKNAEAIRNHVRKELRSSLSSLGIDSLYAYLIHDENDLFKNSLPIFNTLEELKQEGLIERAGVSVYHPATLTDKIDPERIELVQCPVNLLDRRFLNEELRAWTNQHDIDLQARSPFLQGLFFVEETNLPDNIKDRVKPILQRLKEFANQYEVDLDHLLLRFCTRQPNLDMLTFGVDSPDQLRQNMEKLTTELPEDLWDHLNAHDIRTDDQEVLLPFEWET